MTDASGKKFVAAVGVNINCDGDGDIVVTMAHRCGCCHTITFLHPDQVDGLIEILRFAQAKGRACKAGALPLAAAEGRA